MKQKQSLDAVVLLVYLVFLYMPGEEYRYEKQGPSQRQWFIEITVSLVFWAFGLGVATQLGFDLVKALSLAFLISSFMRAVAWAISYLWWKSLPKS